MTWEPTTRGTTPSDQICHFGDCRVNNTEMGFYTVDFFGVRFFCQSHWNWIASFMRTVKSCGLCYRNHNADLYKDARQMNDVKHNNKWWRFCTDHIEYYNKSMCTFLEGLDLTDD